MYQQPDAAHQQVSDTDTTALTADISPNAVNNLDVPTPGKAVIVVESADILKSDAVPVVLLPAVSGKTYLVESILCELEYGSSGYVVSDNGTPTFDFEYTSGGSITSVRQAGFIDGNRDFAVTLYAGQVGPYDRKYFRGNGVQLLADVAPTSGDGKLKVTISYELA